MAPAKQEDPAQQRARSLPTLSIRSRRRPGVQVSCAICNAAVREARRSSLVGDRLAAKARPARRNVGGTGAPDRIRTCDPWLRKPILYPTELRAREAMIIAPGHACTRAQHCRTRTAQYNELLCPRLAPDRAPRELRGHEGTRPALLAHQDAEAADRRRRPR